MSVAGGITLDIRAAAHDKASKVLQQVSKQLEKTKKQLVAGGAAQTDFGRRAAEATRHMGAFGQRLATAADKVGVLAQKVGGLKGGLVATAAIVAGGAIVRLGKDGAAAADRLAVLSKTVDGFAGILADTREATRGMIAERDIVRQSALFKSFGLDMTQFSDAMELASKSAILTGKSTEQMTDSLVTGLARESPKILDNLGIMVDLAEARERAAEMTGKQADALTDAERKAGLMAVTLDKLRESTAGVEFDDAQATAFAQASAAVADAWDALGQALAPVGMMLAPLADMFRSLAQIVGSVLEPVVWALSKAFGAVLSVVAKVFGWIRDVVKFFAGPFWRAFGSAEEATVKLTDALVEQERAAGDLTDALDTLASRAERIETAQDRAVSVLVRVAKAEISAAEARERAGEALSEEERSQLEVNKAFVATTRVTQEFAKAERELAKDIDEATAKMRLSQTDTTAAFNALDEALRLGTISADEYAIKSDEIEAGVRKEYAAVQLLVQAYQFLTGARDAAVEGATGGGKGGKRKRRGGRRAGGATPAQRVQFAKMELEVLRATDEVTKARLQSELEMAELIAGHRGSGKGKDERAAEIALQRAQGQRDILEAVQATAQASADGLKAERDALQVDRDRKAQADDRLRAIGLQMDLLNAETEGEREILRLEYARAEAARELDNASEGDGGKAVARESLAIATERLVRAMDEQAASRFAGAMRLVADGFQSTSSIMQTMSPQFAGVMTSVGQVSEAWAQWGSIQKHTAQDTVNALGSTAQAVGGLLQSQGAEQGAIAAIYGAVELAKGVAATAAGIGGDTRMFAAAAAHFASSGMFFAVAGGAGRAKPSMPSSAGGSASAGSSFGPSPGGGSGTSEATTKTIVVQFGSGVVLGNAQDVGRAVQEAEDAMRGTGSSAGL